MKYQNFLIGALLGLLSVGLIMTWKIPERGRKYSAVLANAEKINGLPHNLLARMAYQESRFRPEIITGDLKSHAGAVGIMQIVPRWHPDVDPRDPIASINYAGRYIKKLYDYFGNWSDALASYNWGIGNLNKFKKGQIARMPTETKNYVSQILKDVKV